MNIYVDGSAYRGGDGSKEQPFKKINEAAQVAKAGDTVLVASGIYREHVIPQASGKVESPIVYRSIEPLGAVITGAERVESWVRDKEDVWKAVVPNGIFGSYNPYTTVVFGDWYFARDEWHTGEVYLNDQSMYEVTRLEEVYSPEVYTPSWEDPEKTLFKWFTEQEGDHTVLYANFHGVDPNEENVEINVRRNCFFPIQTGVNYITVSGFKITKAATTWAPPTAFQDGMIGPHWSKGWIIENCDISHSKCSGISLGKYLQQNNENKWVLQKYKDGTQNERDAICQAQREGWTKELIGSHIVRGCSIHNCEQTGIVGHLGGVFSLIEDNHIYNINNKQQLGGAEISAIKMHAAIDVIYRRNHIHHSTRGLWLDWQAQGTRVTQNLFYDNMPPLHAVGPRGRQMCEDLFVEVSHGPTLVDNNVFLSACTARLSTQGVAFVHNLIAGSFTGVSAGTDHRNGQPRYTPYHVPHRTEVNGFMSFLHGDNRFYNNIFIQQEIPAEYEEIIDWATGEMNFTVGTQPFDGYPTEDEWLDLFQDHPSDNPMERMRKRQEAYFHKLPVWSSGNLYLNGSKPYDKEEDFCMVDKHAELRHYKKDDGYMIETNLYELIPDNLLSIISTETLGEAFEPEQAFEDPDGLPITFNSDYFGDHRSLNPLPGPFCTKEASSLNLI